MDINEEQSESKSRSPGALQALLSGGIIKLHQYGSRRFFILILLAFLVAGGILLSMEESIKGYQRAQKRHHANEIRKSVSMSTASLDWISPSFVPIEPHVGKKRVLVTGGAGFIGYHTCAALLQRGDDVIIVDDLNDYYDPRLKKDNLEALFDEFGRNNGRIKLYVGDIADKPFMEDLFAKENPIRWIVHLAARAGVRYSIEDPYIYMKTNVQGTTVLLELANKVPRAPTLDSTDNAGSRSSSSSRGSLLSGNENFVMASSSSVYGGREGEECFSELDIVDYPVSQYAASKKSTELVGHVYNHLYSLNVTMLRFFTVYGPRGRPDMAPFKFIHWLDSGVPIKRFGDGTTSRDYTYVSDIVDGVIRSLDRRHGYEVFNLGNGHPVYLSDFIETAEKAMDVEATIEEHPPQPGDVPRTCADVSKAKIMLGYQPKVLVSEGLRHTAYWYKDAVGRGLIKPTNNNR